MLVELVVDLGVPVIMRFTDGRQYHLPAPADLDAAVSLLCQCERAVSGPLLFRHITECRCTALYGSAVQKAWPNLWCLPWCLPGYCR